MNQTEREAVKQWYADNLPEIKSMLQALKDLPAQQPEHYAKFVAHQKKMGANVPQLDSIDVSGLTSEFCKDWPLVEKAINAATPFLNFLSGVIPGVGAILKFVPIIEKMVDSTLVPLVCAV